MKLTATVVIACLVAGSGALAQTDVSGSSNTPSGVGGKPGAMTIKQASGGGAPHAPRTGRQPTKRTPHVSAGTAAKSRTGTHTTTSKGLSGVPKGARQPAGKPTR